MAVSDASLSPECFVTRTRTTQHDRSRLRIVFVGTLQSLYKGPDVLVEAVGLCKAQGIPVSVRFLGSGEQIRSLQSRCVQLGIDRQVEFVGNVTAGGPVRQELDDADLFVLPSRAEGVPRAMLEAMARALPCLGSSIGGIPELLHQEDLVSPDNPAALAKAIAQVFNHPAKLQRMSERNLLRATSYSTEILSNRRLDFYRQVKELTANAYAGRHPHWRHSLSSSLQGS
jgi:glycosyltransferase involved in cell wall biosynthesis